MKINSILSDDALLQELAQRLVQQRVANKLTQAQLAKQAGISKRTLERVEAGLSTQLVTFIRILRVLGLVDRLEQLVPLPDMSPMALLEESQTSSAAGNKAKTRQRVRHSSRKPSGVNEPGRGWSWGGDA